MTRNASGASPAIANCRRKTADLTTYGQAALNAVARELNNRPRATLA